MADEPTSIPHFCSGPGCLICAAMQEGLRIPGITGSKYRSLDPYREEIAQRLLTLDDFVNWVAVAAPPMLEQIIRRAREIRRTEFYAWEDESASSATEGKDDA